MCVFVWCVVCMCVCVCVCVCGVYMCVSVFSVCVCVRVITGFFSFLYQRLLNLELFISGVESCRVFSD